MSYSVLLSFFVALVLLAHTPSLAASEWASIPVPGPVEDSATQHQPRDGFGWYRCAVLVPRSWPGSWNVTLGIASVADAHEAYFNGKLIGRSGEFPPDFSSGRDLPQQYPIPKEWLQSGATNIIAIRIFNEQGPGGILQQAPVLSQYGTEIRLEGLWHFRWGDNPAWATPEDALAQSTLPLFSTIQPAISILRQPSQFTPGIRTDPEEALAKMTPAPGLAIDLVLSDPIIAQPLFITFDERGRLWLAEYRQYPFPAGLNMLSRDQHFRAVYDGIPKPPPDHVRGEDRISIHEDTNGDGTFDKHSVFVDGLNLATSCAIDNAGVWVLNPPYLLFYPDKNKDDSPDGPAELHLSGFGLEDTHSLANSLAWGPDGWLYGAQGSTVSSTVSTANSSRPAVPITGQAIWRYHPREKTFEVFAEGGGNAFGCEIDSQGHLFSGHNGGNTRGFHYVQGGYYQKGFDKHGSLSNPYAFGYFPPMKHPDAPRFTHTFVIYEANELPEIYRGRLLGVEPLQGRIICSDISAQGSTFQTTDLHWPLTSTDPTFRPVDIKIGPDGAVYIADFAEQFIAHGQHFQGYLDRQSGRVFRLRASSSPVPRAPRLGEQTTETLLELLDDSNRELRELARRLLTVPEKAPSRSVLVGLLGNTSDQPALEALWLLNELHHLDGDLAEKALHHSNPAVRRWAVRLLCDRQSLNAGIAAAITQLAAHEDDLHVLSQLAASSKQLSAGVGLNLIEALLVSEKGAEDPHIPLLIWWAIEHHFRTVPAQVVELFANPNLWTTAVMEEVVLERLVKRLLLSGSPRDLQLSSRLLQLAPSLESKQRFAHAAEQSFSSGSIPPLPQALTEALAQLTRDPLIWRVRQGDPDAISPALKRIQNPALPVDRRVPLIEFFGQAHVPQSVPILLELARQPEPPEVQRAALAALQAYDSPTIPEVVLDTLSTSTPANAEVALSLLASRPGWATKLLSRIVLGTLDPAKLPSHVVERLFMHDDPDVLALAHKHLPLPTDKLKHPKPNQLLGERAAQGGNPYAGKKLYNLACANCHKLFNDGGNLGPDLTPYNRDDVQTLLFHIAHPSAEIREGYENYVARTTDGRVVNGFLVGEDDQRVTLKDPSGAILVLPRSEIAGLERTGRSLMPEGLLDALSPDQTRDLIAYLRSGQPLPD